MSPQNHTIKGESTIQEIAAKHGVYPNQVSQWKSQVIAGMADLFERPNKKSQEVRQQEEKESAYLKTIGKQKVEIDFLKKSTGSCTERSHQSGYSRRILQGLEHLTPV